MTGENSANPRSTESGIWGRCTQYHRQFLTGSWTVLAMAGKTIRKVWSGLPFSSHFDASIKFGLSADPACQRRESLL